MKVKEVCPDPLHHLSCRVSFSGRVLSDYACHLVRLHGEPFQHCHVRLRPSKLCRQCLCNLLLRLYCLCASLSDHRNSFLSNHSSTVTVNRAFFSPFLQCSSRLLIHANATVYVPIRPIVRRWIDVVQWLSCHGTSFVQVWSQWLPVEQPASASFHR